MPPLPTTSGGAQENARAFVVDYVLVFFISTWFLDIVKVLTTTLDLNLLMSSVRYSR